jgi:hypothetical protein
MRLFLGRLLAASQRPNFSQSYLKKLVQGKPLGELWGDRQHIGVFSVVLDTDFFQTIGFTFFLPVVAGIG